MYLLNQLKQNLSRMNHMLAMISWNLFTPGCMTVSTFYAKTSKMNCAFTSLSGFLFNCPSLIFYNALLF